MRRASESTDRVEVTVATNQNGSVRAASFYRYNDAAGLRHREKDGEGGIHYYSYYTRHATLGLVGGAPVPA